jgi:hypothetical protein
MFSGGISFQASAFQRKELFTKEFGNVMGQHPKVKDSTRTQTFGYTYQIGGVGDLLTTNWLKLSLRADRFSTDDYNTTPKDQRGPLDIATSFLQNNVQVRAAFGPRRPSP